MARIKRPVAGETSSIVKPGEYPAIVVEAKNDTSSNGNPMLVLTFEVDTGKSRRKLKAWIPLHVSYKVEELYTAFPKAIDGEGFLDSELIEGEHCYVDIINEDYQGKKTDKVKEIMPSDDANQAEAKASANQVDDDDCPY